MRHEATGEIQSLTTAANGSAWTTLNIGNNQDGSITSNDWASHGLVVKTTSGNLVGAKTITLDEDLVVLDLFADAERAINHAQQGWGIKTTQYFIRLQCVTR